MASFMLRDVFAHSNCIQAIENAQQSKLHSDANIQLNHTPHDATILSA